MGSRIQRSGPQRTRPYNHRYDRPWRYFSTAVPSSVQFFFCSACANFLKDGTHIGDGAALEKMLILDKAETHMLGKLSPGVNASTTMWSHAGHIWHLNTAMKLSYGHVAIVDRVFKVPIEDVVDGTPESSSGVTVDCVLNPNALLQADQPL